MRKVFRGGWIVWLRRDPGTGKNQFINQSVRALVRRKFMADSKASWMVMALAELGKIREVTDLKEKVRWRYSQ